MIEKWKDDGLTKQIGDQVITDINEKINEYKDK